MKILVSFALLMSAAFANDTGEVKRSEAAKNEFKRSHPCPANGANRGACPGYVIDHIFPLACGGADAPVNMQWQTIEAAKEKDRWELFVTGCPARFSVGAKLKRKLTKGEKP